MTSALTLARPRSARHPSWYLLLFLPGMPLLSRIGSKTMAGDWPASGLSGLGLGLDAAGLLAFIGLALTFAIPDSLEHLGRRVRKEADLLRPAWLTSLFLVQAAGLMVGRDSGIDVMVFAGTCVLLAAIPFGAEFQQRTLAGLLAQPVSRAEWWSLKLLLPACALTLHWALFLLARVVAGLDVSPTLAFSTLMVAAVAWASTPWWTLLSRGLLAGLVFSLTVPLVTLTVFVLTVSALAASDSVQIGGWSADELWFYFLLFLAAPAYGIAALRLGRSRWLRLEAPDQPALDGGVLSLPVFRSRTVGAARRSPVILQLIAKEFRLQTPTLLMGAAALVAGLMNLLPLEALRSQAFYLQGGFLMIAATTLLLAGATTVAEERRLGTLDNQLLLPVSRRFQWWIKLAVALVPALIMGTLIIRTAPPVAVGQGDVLHSSIGIIALAGMFASTLLVSSVTTNSLRALITGTAIATAFLMAGAGAHHLIASWINQLQETHASTWNMSDEVLDLWRTRVPAIPASDHLLTLHRIERFDDAAPAILRWTLALPLLLAVFLARRNFLSPIHDRRRLTRQVVLCFATLVAVLAIGALVQRQLAAIRLDTSMHHMVLRHMEWEAKLSPAEKELLRRGRNRENAMDRTVRVPVRRPDGQPHRGMAPRYALPLSPDTRALLIDRGDIPEPLRDLLRQEAAGDPPQVVPVPDPQPQANIQMSPELMQRYGLIQSPSIPSDPQAQPQPQPQPPPQSPARYQMSPELMKRYGLTPPSPTPP